MTAFLAVIAVGFLAAFWAGWVEPRQVRRARYTVPLRHLKAPLRVVVVADLQPNAYHWPEARLTALFSDLQTREQPDLVFWLGDYFNAPTDVLKEYLAAAPSLRAWIIARLPDMAAIARSMACLRGSAGTVAVLGNHDWAWSGTQTRAALEAADITVLIDDIFVATHQGQDVAITGYDDISSGRTPAFAALAAEVNAGTPNIALSHSPDAFPLDEGGAETMICGHTHGGQVRLPFVGPLLLPVKNRKYDRGWHRADGRRLFVTTGLGTSLPPVRFLCPPEVVVINFVPEEG